jgi:hypothetical protein
MPVCGPSYSGGRGRRIMVARQSKVMVRLYLKSTLKAKGLGKWLKWYSICLASMRP